MMKRILLFAVLLTAAQFRGQNATSSTYKTGIGGRFGFEGGITVKHFIKSDRALEGILSTGWGWGGFRLTGLYEVQKPLKGVDNLDWYFGGGLHVGTYSGRYFGYYGWAGTGYYDHRGVWHPSGYRSRYLVLGLDAIIGLEYKFEEAPFAVSLDFKPYIDLVGWSNRYGDLALSVRYLIR